MIDFKKLRVINLPVNNLPESDMLISLIPDTSSNDCFSEWRRALRYKDYSDEKKAFEEDKNDNIQKHSKKNQPALVRSFNTKIDKIILPVPLICSDSKLARISSLLYTILGVIDVGTFYEDEIFIKTVPSVGARHGIEAYLTLNNKVYYYNCLDHSLVYISESTEDGIQLQLSFRPEIFMWRYENGACIFDVYLDLGHILANLYLACSFLHINYRHKNFEGDVIDFKRQVKLLTIELNLDEYH